MKAIIYGKPSCPYCDKAKRLLTNDPRFDVQYVDLSLPENQQTLNDLKAGGMRTVPQIYVDNVHIGGYRELVEAMVAKY